MPSIVILVTIWIILTQSVTISNQWAVEKSEDNELYKFKCVNTNPEDFLYEFLHIYENVKTTNFLDYDLEITNSNFSNIHSFSPPIAYSKGHLKKFAITNSSVEFIEDYAFESLIFASILVLSNNNLKDMSFVESLPRNLEKLYLNGNYFKAVTNVFGHLINLSYLDLSSCHISNIHSDSFQVFHKSLFLNISNNELTSFDPVFNKIELEIDLSFNNIKYVNYNGKSIDFRGLNMSHNKIESIGDVLESANWYTNHVIEFVDLSFNDLGNEHFLNSSILINILNLNLANSNIGTIQSQMFADISVGGSLDLSGNNLGTLTSCVFQINIELKNLSLVNASISNIHKNAFNAMSALNVFDILNISTNPISVLKDYTFNNIWINTLDMSKCLLQKIEGNAFFGLSLRKALILSHNKLTYLHKSTFQNLNEVQIIDLSFNILKKLDNDLFTNCKALEFLKLSHSRIEVIRSRAFNGTSNLIELDLSNNLIGDIVFESSSLLRIVDLQNNKISNLEFSFFQNLSTTVLLLKGNKIAKLKKTTSHTKGCVKEMDLSQSSICDIEPNSFRGLSSLEVLNLRDNCINEIQAGTFISLRKLIKLDLTGNKIVSFLSSSFAFGNQLSKLDITFQSSNLGSKTFILLNHLKSLSVFDSVLVSLEKNCFKGLTYLETLNLNNVEIKGVVPGAFNGLDNLERINSQVLFKNMPTLKFGTFQGLRKLNLLDLSQLNISLIQSQAFSGLTNLKTLLLNENKVNSLVSGTFLGLSFLKTLNLSSNRISEINIDAFSGLDNLSELSLTNNNLENISLGTFQKFPHLKVLNLCKNKIYKLMTGTFSNLKSLVKLDLSYNNISTLKMENLFPLSNLEYLDLSANRLIEIEYLGLVKSLRHLRYVGLNDNKWRCNVLGSMLISFQNHSIGWISDEKKVTYYTSENVDGIKCIDICKFFYCVDDHS